MFSIQDVTDTRLSILDSMLPITIGAPLNFLENATITQVFPPCEVRLASSTLMEPLSKPRTPWKAAKDKESFLATRVKAQI
jgi:hypothetical protein